MKLYAKMFDYGEKYGIEDPAHYSDKKLYTEEEIKDIQLEKGEFFMPLECDTSKINNDTLYVRAGYDYDLDDGQSFLCDKKLYSKEEIEELGENSAWGFYEYSNQRELEMHTIDIMELGKSIGMEEQEKNLPNGKVIKSLVWDQENLKKAVKEVSDLSGEGKPVRITGAAPAWLVSALTHTVHPCPVSLYDPKLGKDIPIPQLAHGEPNPEGEVAFEVTEKGDAVLIEWNIDHESGIYDENNLPKVVVPEVSQGKAVYISGRGPNYLTVAMAEAYAHTNSSVSLNQPGIGYTCSITHTRSKGLGDLTKDPIGKEEIKEELKSEKDKKDEKVPGEE